MWSYETSKLEKEWKMQEGDNYWGSDIHARRYVRDGYGVRMDKCRNGGMKRSEDEGLVLRC